MVLKVRIVLEGKKRKRRASYLQAIQIEFPLFLHELYCYASSTLGYNSNNYKIRTLMTKKARVDYPDCPVIGGLNLTRYAFHEFFVKNSGYYTKLSRTPTSTVKLMNEMLEFSKKYSEVVVKRNDFSTVYLMRNDFIANLSGKSIKSYLQIMPLERS